MANSHPVASWKPGIPSPNPGGRPKREWTFAQLYEDALNEFLTTPDGTRIQAKQAVAKRLMRMAVEGDLGAIKELSNRLDGNPTQPLDGGVNLDGTRRPLEVLINSGQGFLPPVTKILAPPDQSTPANEPEVQGNDLAPKGKKNIHGNDGNAKTGTR
jgi:hypothetical protein